MSPRGFVRRTRNALACLRGRAVISMAYPLPAFVTHGNACSIDPLVRFLDCDGETITLGDRVMLRRNCELCGLISIGSRTRFNRDVYLRRLTTIGADVSVGPFAKFITDTHTIESIGLRRTGPSVWKPIVVGDGAWIGAGAIILGGVTIGRGAIVGAGSIVTRDVEPDCVYAGNPARLLRRLEPLREDAARVAA